MSCGSATRGRAGVIKGRDKEAEERSEVGQGPRRKDSRIPKG